VLLQLEVVIFRPTSPQVWGGEVLRWACCRPMSVSLYVSPLACLKNNTSELHTIFCTCYLRPWVGPCLITVQYVMYFRFCGWRHIVTMGHMVHGVGNIDMSAVLKEVVKITNVFARGLRAVRLVYNRSTLHTEAKSDVHQGRTQGDIKGFIFYTLQKLPKLHLTTDADICC